MRRGRAGFTRPELVLVAGAAAVVFSRVFAFSLVLPGFREHADGLQGATDLLVGAALGAYGLTMALAQVGMGALSDRWGRRPVLLLGTAVFAAGSIASAVADSIGALLGARLLQGLGGISAVAMATVGEAVPEERRTTAMALVGIPAGLGFFLGFAAGPVAAQAIGFRGLFWSSAAVGAVAVLPLLLRPLARPQHTPDALPRRTAPALWALGVAGFAGNFAMTHVAFFLPERGLGTVGLLAALAGAFAAMLVASKRIDRRRAGWQPIALAVGTLAAGSAAFLAAPGRIVWLGALAFFAGHAVLSAAVPAQVSRLAGRRGGRGHGVQLVAAYLGSAAGGVAAGAAAHDAGLAAGVVVAVAALALAASATWLRAAATRPSGPQPSSEAGGGHGP